MASTTVIVASDPSAALTLRTALDPDATTVGTLDDLRRHLGERSRVDVVVLGPNVDADGAFRLSEELRLTHPAVGVVLIRARVDTSLLGDALRAGIREVVSDRDLATAGTAVRRVRDLAHALRDQSATPAENEDAPTGRLVTVFSAKGGCGKTTLATNLAATLADGGRRRVCLVDLDLAFGDVAIALQLFPAHTIADAVPLADRLDAQAVEGLITPHSAGLDTIVAPIEPGSAETIPGPLVSELLRLLKSMYGYVVVDTPPAFTDHVLAAFDASETIALIATLDIPALKNLKLTLETLELLNYPRERWRVLLNRADSKVGLTIGEVEKTLRAPITTQIPSSRSVPASINRGVPIMLDEPGHAVSAAIRDFAVDHVIAAQATHGAAIPAPLRDDRRGLFRRKAKTT